MPVRLSISANTVEQPVIFYSVYYAGTAAQAQPYLTPFLDLGPVAAINDSIAYPDLADATGSGSNSPFCQDGRGSGTEFPVGLKKYNATANRAVHNLYKKMIAEQPAFNRSIVQFESYPVQKMKSVDPASTAYPHRDDNVLTYGSLLDLPQCCSVLADPSTVPGQWAGPAIPPWTLSYHFMAVKLVLC